MAEKQLYLHTSNRVENLAARLVDVSSQNPLRHPLSQETVMTLNPGIARWLQFKIAKQAGVAFGWDFPLPGKLFARLLGGFEPSYEAEGHFPEDRARWILLDLLEKLEDLPSFAQVRAYCADESGSRRLSFAQKLTTLYDEYLVYRPEVVLRWEEEPDTSRFDWQAELWRRLIKRLYPQTGSPRHIARVWKELMSGQILDLGLRMETWPERLFVFGVSSLAPLYLDLLTAFSIHRPTHLFLLQPSDLYWADLKTSKQIRKIVHKRTRSLSETKRRDLLNRPEDWLFETGNPLLPALGKQGQMFLDLLIDADPQQDDRGFAAPDPGRSQLQCLQSDLFTIYDRSDSAQTDPFPEYDGSIQVHSCPGPRREVETLWDYLVNRFERDPALKPGDILVMAPDIQRYRSHVEAVFRSKAGTRLEIPYTLADSASHSLPGVVSGLVAILEVLNKRVTALEVIELLETPLLREAFGFSDQDLERFESWIRELGITWGWDQRHRTSHHGFGTDRNTWKELRQRLISGIMLPDRNGLPSGFAAFSDIEGELGAAAGRLTECLLVVEKLGDALADRQSLVQWRSQLLDTIDVFSCDRDDWTRPFGQVRQLVTETLPEIPEIFVSGREVFRALLDKLKALPSGSGYLSGGVTFCSLKPMRAIPANTVCLLGMNRLDYPRSNRRLSFDLLSKETRIGDRSTRDEDRQFFLETLLSAREHFFISYRGLSPTNDSELEPSSVVEELLNYLKQSMHPDDFRSVLRRQKRLSFDRMYFEDDPDHTYDPNRAELFNRFHGQQPDPGAPEGVPPTEHADPVTELDLEAFIRFFCDPAKYFLENRAKAKLTRMEESLPETDSLDTSALDRYGLRTAFAERLQRGESIESISVEAFSREKKLPPGKPALFHYLEELEAARALAARIGQAFSTTQRRVALQAKELTLFGDILLQDESGLQMIVHAGDLNAKRVIDAWIRHVVACACESPFSGTTEVFSLYPKAKPIRFERVDEPLDALERLADLFVSGQNVPLALFPEASLAAFRELVSENHGSETERNEKALDRAARTLFGSSAYYQSAAWSEYDAICFGNDYALDACFLERSQSFWEPIEAAKADALSTTRKGARLS